MINEDMPFKTFCEDKKSKIHYLKEISALFRHQYPSVIWLLVLEEKKKKKKTYSKNCLQNSYYIMK